MHEFTVPRHKGESLLYFPDSYIVVDIETTGLDPEADEIIELAALKVKNNEIIDTFQTLVKPNQQIDSFITSLTGITNDMVEYAPNIKSALSKFLAFVGDTIIVGHNVHFDINFLYDNANTHLEQIFSNDFVDTLRLSRKYMPDAPNYKLTTLVDFLHIDRQNAHRALSDCEVTHKLLCHLKQRHEQYQQVLMQRIQTVTCPEFANKRVVVKGTTKAVSYDVIEAMCNQCNAHLSNIFYSNTEYLIFGYNTYKKYKRGDLSEKMLKADKLTQENGLIVLSEYEFYAKLGLSDLLPMPHKRRYRHQNVSAKELVSNKTEFDPTHPLFEKVCVFTGTLERMTRKDAMQAVLDYGGTCGNGVTSKTNYLVLGNNDYCQAIKDGKSNKHKRAEELKQKGNDIEIISENVFYDMLDD